MTIYDVHNKVSLLDLFYILKNIGDYSSEHLVQYFNTYWRLGVNPYKKIYLLKHSRYGLYDILYKLKIKNIIYPAFICPDLITGALKYGIKPIFVDVDPGSYHIDFSSISYKDIERAGALFAIHTFGAPFNTKTFHSFKESYNLTLIEDAAHALYSSYDQEYVGINGDFSIFSLYKQIPNINGSVLLSTINDDLITISRDSMSLSDLLNIALCVNGPHTKLLNVIRQKNIKMKKLTIPGGTYSLSNLSLSFFNHLASAEKKCVEDKNKLIRCYDERLDHIKYLTRQDVKKNSVSSWYNYSICLTHEYVDVRDELYMGLRKNGIFCTKLWHDAPVTSPYFQKYLFNGEYYNSNYLSKSIINLPIKSYYNQTNINYIFNIIETILEEII